MIERLTHQKQKQNKSFFVFLFFVFVCLLEKLLQHTYVLLSPVDKIFFSLLFVDREAIGLVMRPAYFLSLFLC